MYYHATVQILIAFKSTENIIFNNEHATIRLMFWKPK